MFFIPVNETAEEFSLNNFCLFYSQNKSTWRKS